MEAGLSDRDALTLVAALVGMIAGSFTLAVAWRSRRGLPWLWARSACPACGTVLGARDLVPLLSWMAARGRARCCGARISRRYPAAELIGAALFGLPPAIGASGSALPPIWAAACLLSWAAALFLARPASSRRSPATAILLAAGLALYTLSIVFTT